MRVACELRTKVRLSEHEILIQYLLYEATTHPRYSVKKDICQNRAKTKSNEDKLD